MLQLYYACTIHSFIIMSNSTVSIMYNTHVHANVCIAFYIHLLDFGILENSFDEATLSSKL